MTDESAPRDVLNVERAATVARIRHSRDLDAIVAASANTNNDDEHGQKDQPLPTRKHRLVRSSPQPNRT